MQNCLSCKSSISWEYSKTFLPANLSQLQIINILGIFKDISPANLSQPQIINILGIFEKFSPVKLSQPQIIKIPGIFKDFFACKIILAAANHRNPGKIQKPFGLQNCLSRKSSKSREYSKTFSPAELSQPQIIKILGLFKDFIACKIILAAANHQNPGNIQRFFCLENYLSRKSSKSWKYSKTFACKIVLAANRQYPGKFQRVFRLQNCLSCKSSVSCEYSETFSPANLSQPQIINILGIIKNFRL